MRPSYFSEREIGPRPRVADEISPRAWAGIRAHIQTLIDDGAFGLYYPRACADNGRTYGTNERTFVDALNAAVPGLDWPVHPSETPATLDILDAVEFCYDSVAAPIWDDHHRYYDHYHLDFNEPGGKQAFRETMSRIFARNGLVYEVGEDGIVTRLAPPVLRDELTSAVFQTGDADLDRMLESSRAKYLDPDPAVRRESLEKLWDAWERVKSLCNPTNKQVSITELLDKAAGRPKFREIIEADARDLTSAGNKLLIRHSEVSQEPVETSSQIDYLFHRLFSLIWLLLRSR